MFEWLKNFFAGKASTNWKRKRTSRAYQKRVRALERDLRRQANNEDVAARYVYFSPYSNLPPSEEAIKRYRKKHPSSL